MPDNAAEPDNTAWQLAKWLIPSVTMLFLVVGYVAMHGHESLLGWDQGLRDINEYVATTADFMGSVIANLLDLPSYRTAFLDPIRLLVLCTSVALLAACSCLIAEGRWVPRRLQLAGRARLHWAAARKHPELALTCGLILVVVLKASVIDVPLAKVEGVLVSQINAKEDLLTEHGTNQTSVSLGARLTKQATGSGVFGAVANRSNHLYEIIACSRRYDDDTNQILGLPCPAKQDAFAEEQSEFTTQIVSGTVVLVLAYLLIQRTTSKMRVGLAWLCIASTLSVPYAFGKLKMSTERDFALIALKTRLDQAGDDKSSNMKQLVGVMLTRDRDTTTIATLQKIDCEGTAQLVRFWRISNSEIVWAREIFRTDVIAWKLSQETNNCKGKTPYANQGSK